MRYHSKILVTFFLITSVLAGAQNDIVIKKKEFKARKSGFDEAWKHVKDGDLYYSQGGIWYGKAFDEYLEASAYNNNNPELNFKIGTAALFSDHKENAYGYLSKSIDRKPNIAKDILLFTGRSLQYAGKYAAAIELFNKYLASNIRKSDSDILEAKKFIEECTSALIITSDTLSININNAGININSSADEYSQILTGDGTVLFFASRRGLPKSSKYYSDSKFDENIFVSAIEDNSWGAASPLSEEINTPYCETPLFISASNDSLYIYTGYENGGDIMLSVKRKGKWKLPQQINPDFNSKDNESSFTVSPSDQEIYFVSNRKKDNLGGKDIFFIRKTGDKKWSDPLNAGPVINSAYDEEAVHFSVTGDTLWFSSKGHNSIGGFDMFFSVRNKSGDWSAVQNLGYPVNTPWDDAFYYPSPDEKNLFYFVSNRPGGAGGLDIYTGRFINPDTIVQKK